MKKIFLSFPLFLLFVVSGTKAGAQTAAKCMFFEIGGPGIASFNFDARFSNREDGLGGRIGVGGFDIGDVGLLAIPVGLNYLFGHDERHYFELGGGASFINHSGDSDDDGILNTTIGYFNFGYRLQPKQGGFLFRAAIVPVFNKYGFLPYYAGLSFGYKFGSKSRE